MLPRTPQKRTAMSFTGRILGVRAVTQQGWTALVRQTARSAGWSGRCPGTAEISRCGSVAAAEGEAMRGHFLQEMLHTLINIIPRRKVYSTPFTCYFLNTHRTLHPFL